MKAGAEWIWDDLHTHHNNSFHFIDGDFFSFLFIDKTTRKSPYNFGSRAILFATLDVLQGKGQGKCLVSSSASQYPCRKSTIENVRSDRAGSSDVKSTSPARTAWFSTLACATRTAKTPMWWDPDPDIRLPKGLTEYSRQRTVGTYRKPRGRGSSVHRLPSYVVRPRPATSSRAAVVLRRNFSHPFTSLLRVDKETSRRFRGCAPVSFQD